MPLSRQTVDQIAAAVQTQRLVETATALIEIPSPTRSAAAVADRLAEILREDGFEVERDAPFGLTQVAINARHQVNDAAGPRSKSSQTYGFKSASLKSQTAPFISIESEYKQKYI